MVRLRFLFLLTLLSFGLSRLPASGATLLVSWYGTGLENRRMADGEPFHSSDASIAAHRTLPFGTVLTITNPANRRKAVVVVQDRGPFKHGRSLDLSYAAALRLGFAMRGVTRLRVHVVRARQN